MDNYQVIITLGGTGKRFSDAGYSLPKYMLPVDINNPNYKVINMVSDMYKGMKKIYLCNKYHIDKYDLKSLLETDNSTVVGVEPGKGPGDAILQASKYIDLQKHTFVQYCDTFQPWDLNEVISYISSNKCDAGVVVTNEKCPSVFDGTLYGRVKVENNIVKDIKEKAPEEYSDYLGCGTFYFNDGELLLKYINIQDKNKDKYYLNGESYINCTIKAMLDDDCSVLALNTINYLNLGVPRDYEEFMYWQKTYNNINNTDKTVIENSTLIMPAAGLGSRFKDTFKSPKPLIEMKSGNKMFQDAIKYSFPSQNVVIVTRKDLDFYDEFEREANQYKFIGLNEITDGQALTIKAGLNENINGPIIINSCDQGILYDEDEFNRLYSDADIIICGLKNYNPAINKPTSFSWIKSDGYNVTEITSKRCEGDPRNSSVFISCMIYKNRDILEKSIESLISRDARTNGEFYIDESINDSIKLGYKVKQLQINSYINWGTPEELQMFNWWINFYNNITHGYLA